MDIHRLRCNSPTWGESLSAPIERRCRARICSAALVTVAAVMGACFLVGCGDSSQIGGASGDAGSSATSATGKGGTTRTGSSTGAGGGSGGTTTSRSASGGMNGSGGRASAGGSADSGGARGTGGAEVGGGGRSGGSGGTSTKGIGGTSNGGFATDGGDTGGRTGANRDAGRAESGAGGGATGGGATGGARIGDAAAGRAAAGGSSGTGTSACNPADKKADPTPVSFTNPGSPPSGPYKVTIEQDPGISDHTVYRPTDLSAAKLPIIAWGEGGCAKNGTKDFAELLSEFTSYGFLILADGPPNGTGATGSGSDATPMVKAIDWAIAENARPCSQYYQKIDTSKVAVMGQSCGGLMAYAAAGDPRVTTVVAMNSGLISVDQKTYDSLHAPMAIIDGGSEDMAYANGARDFENIKSVPIIFANYPYGHYQWFPKDNGGEFGKAGVAWLKWQLLGDEGATGKGMFLGANCGLCSDPSWTIQQKNMN